MNSEAEKLEREILSAIRQRRVADFDDLALRIFRFQLQHNAPYARYAAALGVTLDTFPSSWQSIPAVPAAAFKEADLATFDPLHAELVFETSGTTTGSGGKHFMATSTLYDAALLPGFHDAFLSDVPASLRYLFLVPNPEMHPRSSLGYMMLRVAETYGNYVRWYVEGERIDLARFLHDVRNAQAACAPVLLAGTAFAFVQLLDTLRERGILLPLPASSRIMETGGFKGRTRSISRDDLYAELERVFSVRNEQIISEYGMTELSSQYYSVIPRNEGPQMSAAREERQKIFHGPAWMRSYAVGVDGKPLPPGTVGALVHVDLANLWSCVAILTEDLGAVVNDGLVLIGRDRGAELRGCSLDAEFLKTSP